MEFLVAVKKEDFTRLALCDCKWILLFVTKNLRGSSRGQPLGSALKEELVLMGRTASALGVWEMADQGQAMQEPSVWSRAGAASFGWDLYPSLPYGCATLFHHYTYEVIFP
ncbi:uncharacterized protein LOC144578591 [Callithrix jacchus]